MKSFTRPALFLALALFHPTRSAWAEDTAYIEGSSRISVGPNGRFGVALAGSWR
jgi:hypothetical protein